MEYISGKEKKPKHSKTLTQNIYEMLMLSFLLGAEHAAGEIELSDVVDEPLTFEEAKAFLSSRIPMDKAEFEQLDKKMKLRAFAVSRLSQLDAVERIKELLKEAVSKGKTKEEFVGAATQEELLEKTGFSQSNPWYWENVFRTNVQSAYNAGRAYQIRRVKPKYLEFVGIEDSRQTQICRSRSGIIRPADDEFWENNWPPLHFSCRSTVRPIHEAEAKAYAIRSTPKTRLKMLDAPQKGFGANPLDSGSFYKLTPSMIERAKKYGVYDEIKKLAEKLGLKDGI